MKGLAVLAALLVCLPTLAINNEFENDLTEIKVASIYERVTDGMYYINRSIDDVINILKETKTEFIFRAWWRWSPCPESQNVTLPPEYPSNYVEEATKRGFTYEHLEDAVDEIKKEIPDTIFCGAIPAQRITRLVWNPITSEYFDTEKTWEMALDPSKWSINMTKEEFQYEFAKTHFWIDSDSELENYDYRDVSAYFPDITNEGFRELFLSWAIKQVDCGVDAIWIDMFFTQAIMLEKLTNDTYHPAVRESHEAACTIIDEIHEYGNSVGKCIYVGTWSTCAAFPFSSPLPALDFVTASPSSLEVYEREIDEEKWAEKLRIVGEKFGDIPFFAFIDWAATTYCPLGVFSQYLSREEQREFLKIADIFFAEKDINFIYPVHGGSMGIDSEIRSYGEWNVYDSLAPEFQTYETIKELAENKSMGNPMIYIDSPDKGYLYIFDTKMVPAILDNTLIIGRLTVEVKTYAEGGMDRVEFYVDNVLRCTDNEFPYEWLWDEFVVGRHEIKVVAYDNEGNTASDKKEVMIFNI